MSSSAVSTADLPLPSSYSRKVDDKGRAYYAHHETQSTSWLHPTKLAELQAAGFVASSTAGSGDGGASSLADAEEYTAKGQLPPWVVEEVSLVPTSEGEHESYWVDYRTGIQNPSQSPVDIYIAKQNIAARKQQNAQTVRDESGCSERL